MLGPKKIDSDANAITTALAALNESCISIDAAQLSLQSPKDPYDNNVEHVYARPSLDSQTSEWIEVDLTDAEVSRLVADSVATGTTTASVIRNESKGCYRTSTSSGYSSYSPPLSAASNSCYAIPPITRKTSSDRSSIPIGVRNQFGGLAVIHESEAIPRPIWPASFIRDVYNHYSRPQQNQYSREGIHRCCGGCCCHSYSYNSGDWEDPRRVSGLKAREVLLELSHTLNSMIENESIADMTPKEILLNISETVSQGIDVDKKGSCEYVDPKYSTLSDGKNKFLRGKVEQQLLTGDEGIVRNEEQSCFELSVSQKVTSSKINPINSMFYESHHRCCHHYIPGHKFDDLKMKNVQILDNRLTLSDDIKGLSSFRRDFTKGSISGYERSNDWDRKRVYKKEQNSCGIHQSRDNIKEMVALCSEGKQNPKDITLINPEVKYAMGLSSSDGVSLTDEGLWSHYVRRLADEFDFTLDVTRAERLSEIIIKAKRNRQLCRVFTTFFGLVFFVLSVVTVSLSVTRGRKVFGSM
ncbi:uncharacterized protein [Prorops nasuta]|uniref:uncharacterized protein n=1 Tax=Prorops nasuta TaxID=863751 RepID=UPI0034CFA411